MTDLSTTEDFNAGFALAHALRDPAVRQQFKDLDYDGITGKAVVVAYGPLETRENVIARIRDDEERRVLLVGMDATEPTGWRMEWMV